MLDAGRDLAVGGAAGAEFVGDDHPRHRAGLLQQAAQEAPGRGLVPAVLQKDVQDVETPSRGAATGLWAATSPLLAGRGGLYLEDCEVARATDEDGPMDDGWVRGYAVDPASAARLWQLSVAATGTGPIGESASHGS